ncbi:DNA-binding protein [Actinoplanes ianthinogenes]|uniref:DNA-binding protein n=1 Tax=Actinoplanes ianthinogenes TaxID=122358 RepID=A0ABM7LXD7_9ACTN|nr:septation protein SepH [Actinoplanes ianthinogenes]BCJ43976.1 DNA-binding protein [Actinoplanes ianthinogenes]GGR39516.1 DNA-binding protein [Actinoplanes ianthinogenes]
MRPVRFVALSEDGQALVLADEVGRLLALPLDDRVTGVITDGPAAPGTAVAVITTDNAAALSPRDIQARIRSGESAEEVARIAGVPVDRVLRYAGPVLQERAMLAQHARRTRLKTSDSGQPLAEVVDSRLAQHGIDTEKISWDAFRKDDGAWRIVATWPSGKATAQAIWDLDKGRQVVSPHDDMAQYLCAERPTQILGQEPAPERGGHGLPGPARSSEPTRGGHGLPAADAPARPTRDPIRAGRDALLASLDRPLEGSSGRGLEPVSPAARRPVAGGAAALLGGGSGSAFDDDSDLPKEVPAVPSLAVLRPRRTVGQTPQSPAEGEENKPRKRLPSWDDVLFGGGPAARESS